MTPTDPHARNTDPGTSHAAAARIEPGAAKHRARIMRTLEIREGTFEEIAERAQLRDSQVWRRLPDLEKLGFAEPTGEERLGKSGRWQRVWTVGKNWRPNA
jgi:predicted ArsR family transcriptional regulator